MRLSVDWVKAWIEDLKKGSFRAGVVPGREKTSATATGRQTTRAGSGANKGGRKFASRKDVYDKGYEGVAETKKRSARRVIYVNKTEKSA